MYATKVLRLILILLGVMVPVNSSLAQKTVGSQQPRQQGRRHNSEADSKPTIPDAVRVALNKAYPGWSRTGYSKETADRFMRHKVPFEPNLCWCDFDGDGQRDYAVQIVHHCANGECRDIPYSVRGGLPVYEPDEFVLVAFVRRGKGFEQHVLEKGAVQNGVGSGYVQCFSKGTNAYDFGQQKNTSYENDAVGIVYPASGFAFVYEHGHFRKITNSD